MSKTNNYPTVFIHGYIGFGEEDFIDKFVHYWGFRPDRDLMKWLSKKGYEVYHPALGPFNSAWDRSCTLYAYLFGGRVDYGKVHSEKYGHARYGRTYPGVLKDLGKPGKHKKINLVGHSFGGPTVIAFSNLLTNGCKEEIEATPADELSPLFKGGQGDILHTVTTLSGVNNGTTLTYDPDGDNTVAFLSAMIVLGEIKLVRKFWDFKMEHWGIMPEKKDVKRTRLRSPKKYTKEIDNFRKNWLDHIGNEMTLEARLELNKITTCNPNTYYFARCGQCSEDSGDGKHIPGKKTTSVSRKNSCFIGSYWDDNLSKLTGDKKGNWFPNDGFVNIPGQKAPFNLPSKEAGLKGPFNKSGIWYNLPIENKDHLSWAGLGEKKRTFYHYYKDMLDMFASLESK